MSRLLLVPRDLSKRNGNAERGNDRDNEPCVLPVGTMLERLKAGRQLREGDWAKASVGQVRRAANTNTPTRLTKLTRESQGMIKTSRGGVVKTTMDLSVRAYACQHQKMTPLLQDMFRQNCRRLWASDER